jgi:hypothetical protein
VSGFKAARDRLTLFLGADASGDLKIKPLVILKVLVLGGGGSLVRNSSSGWED